MWDVFAQARKVLVWLGDSTPLDTFAFLQIWRLAAYKDIIADGDETNDLFLATSILDNTAKCQCCSELISADSPRFSLVDSKVKDHFDRWVRHDAFKMHTRIALDQLLRREWFTRLWLSKKLLLHAT
jgi:hypothetical protein